MSQEAREVAQTILSQISEETRKACGVRSMVCGVSPEKMPFLQIRVGGDGWKYIRVYYTPNDDYNVEMCEVLGKEHDYAVKQVEEAEGVYCDQLSSIIYHMVNK